MKNCIFCNFPDKETLIYQDKLCYAIISKDPINKHHVLVIPKKHYRDFLDLPPKTASHLFSVVKKLSKAVVKACKPDAVTYTFDDDFSNCGINTVPHYKFHIIPRFKKDIHLIVWKGLRVHANAEARSKFAKDVKRHLR